MKSLYYAAESIADGSWWVWMIDSDNGYHSAIQKCRGKEACEAAVIRWQHKEDKASKAIKEV